MSYNLKTLQKEEAVTRMKMLNILPETIQDFNENDTVYRSERGILFYLNEKESKMVKEWEKESEGLVYHVIKNHLEFGLCYSFLYVSKTQKEWDMDKCDLKDMVPFVFVANVGDQDSEDATKDFQMDPMCSEFGSIGVKPAFGGVLRTQ